MKKRVIITLSVLLVVAAVLTVVLIKHNSSNTGDIKTSAKTEEKVQITSGNNDVAADNSLTSSINGESYNPSEYPEKFTVPESEFYFVPRQSFSSRQEVLTELDRIDDYYYEYTYGRDIEGCALAKEKCSEMSKEVYKKLNEFPPSDDEILAEKERMLNQEVGMCKDDIIQEKTIIKSGDKEKLKALEEKYESALATQDDYKSGKITIDEALKLLNILDSTRLEAYYAQVSRYNETNTSKDS